MYIQLEKFRGSLLCFANSYYVKLDRFVRKCIVIQLAEITLVLLIEVANVSTCQDLNDL
jgi:hypothetical protein